MTRALYRGFSTANHLAVPSAGFSVSDVQLINQDLLNHINTALGERVMMPNFGTRIPLLAFEPLDEITLGIVEEDLKKVFAYDPRVKLLNLAVFALPNDNAIGAFADLQYLNIGKTETLKLEFPTAG
jgi:phage baseplate assembly protein W